MSSSAPVNWLKPSPSHLRIRLIPFAERVCRLYKLWIKETANVAIMMDPTLDPRRFRLEACRLRKRFDILVAEKDPKRANTMLESYEREYLKKRTFSNMQYANSPGGCAYEREWLVNDCVLDSWHPLEKLQYPDYFARRERRKREAIEAALLQYGPPITDDAYWHEHMAGLPPGYSVLIERGGLEAIRELWGETGVQHAREKLAHSPNLLPYVTGEKQPQGFPTAIEAGGIPADPSAALPAGDQPKNEQKH